MSMSMRVREIECTVYVHSLDYNLVIPKTKTLPFVLNYVCSMLILYFETVHRTEQKSNCIFFSCLIVSTFIYRLVDTYPYSLEDTVSDSWSEQPPRDLSIVEDPAHRKAAFGIDCSKRKVRHFNTTL